MGGIMTILQWAFDGLLSITLLWLAWRALNSPDLFKSIVLFIAFGLLMALAWVRLEAPDVALAEVAIGAGLTGALLLAAMARLKSSDNMKESESIDIDTLRPAPNIQCRLFDEEDSD